MAMERIQEAEGHLRRAQEHLNQMAESMRQARKLEAKQASEPISLEVAALPVETRVLLTPEELVSSEKHSWKNFLGKEIKVPAPPQELLDTLSNAQEQGVTVFEAHYLPAIEFKQNLRYPGWKVKPGAWYWEQIKTGRVAKDAANLDGAWVLVDGSQKPDYDNGRQLYENDPFGKILAKLRNEGNIEVPSSYKHVPETSRFAVTPDERESHFYVALAQVLKVDANQVRVPREIEFNVLGNIHHPDWGQTNTWEWAHDRFGDDGRLDGGSSNSGGLTDVDYDWHDYRCDGIGFRPLVVFPSKKS